MGYGGGLTCSRICIICCRWLHCWQKIWAQWGFTGIFWSWHINGMERVIFCLAHPVGTTKRSLSGESVAGKRIAICFRWTFVHRKGRHTKWGKMRRMRSEPGHLCGRKSGSAWWIQDLCQMEWGDILALDDRHLDGGGKVVGHSQCRGSVTWYLTQYGHPPKIIFDGITHLNNHASCCRSWPNAPWWWTWKGGQKWCSCSYGTRNEYMQLWWAFCWISRAESTCVIMDMISIMYVSRETT